MTVAPVPIFLWKMAFNTLTRFDGLRFISSKMKGTAFPPMLTIRLNEGWLVMAVTDERKRVSRCQSVRHLSNSSRSSFIVCRLYVMAAKIRFSLESAKLSARFIIIEGMNCDGSANHYYRIQKRTTCSTPGSVGASRWRRVQSRTSSRTTAGR